MTSGVELRFSQKDFPKKVFRINTSNFPLYLDGRKLCAQLDLEFDKTQIVSVSAQHGKQTVHPGAHGEYLISADHVQRGCLNWYFEPFISQSSCDQPKLDNNMALRDAYLRTGSIPVHLQGKQQYTKRKHWTQYTRNHYHISVETDTLMKKPYSTLPPKSFAKKLLLRLNPKPRICLYGDAALLKAREVHAQQHDGHNRVEETLQRDYVIEHLRRNVLIAISECDTCSKHAPSAKKAPTPIYTSRPHELVMMDLKKMPMATADGYVYLLVLKDHFSKYQVFPALTNGPHPANTNTKNPDLKPSKPNPEEPIERETTGTQDQTHNQPKPNQKIHNPPNTQYFPNSQPPDLCTDQVRTTKDFTEQKAAASDWAIPTKMAEMIVTIKDHFNNSTESRTKTESRIKTLKEVPKDTTEADPTKGTNITEWEVIITPPHGPTICKTVNERTSIQDIKTIVENIHGFPAQSQTVWHQTAKQMDEAHIKSLSTPGGNPIYLTITLSLRGGMDQEDPQDHSLTQHPMPKPDQPEEIRPHNPPPRKQPRTKNSNIDRGPNHSRSHSKGRSPAHPP